MKGKSGYFLIAILSLLALAAVYLSFGKKETTDGHASSAQAEDNNLYIDALMDMEGKQEQMDPEKLIFLNVWATWCGPCNIEMPGIQALYDRYRDNDKVRFYIVSDEDPETVLPFVKRKGYALPFFQYLGQFPRALDGNAIPRTYIIYKDRILREGIGAAHWDTPEIHHLIETSLNAL